MLNFRGNSLSYVNTCHITPGAIEPKAVKSTCVEDEFFFRLTFNPGLALTQFLNNSALVTTD